MSYRWIYIEDISDYEGEKVEVRGWLYNKRHSGKLYFLLVRDGTDIVQCVVFQPEVEEEVFEAAGRLTQESSVIVRGTVRKDTRAPHVGYEITVEDIELVQLADGYPIGPKEHGIDFLLQHRHLWLRSLRQHAILRIRHEVTSAIRDFFNSHGFILIDEPIFTPSACEGTTTLFETEHFGNTAYLSQSGQLYNEAACMSFGKVYCFGPTFRAEKSKTRRHLTEFWMVEPEVAYCDLNGIIDLAEEFVEYVVQRVVDERRKELERLERDISKLEKVKRPFPRISYSEAVEILKEKGMRFDWGEDFGGDEETAISERFDKPVIVHRYPLETKAFYMKTDPNDPRLALCMDMLAPEGYGEIIGGGQREDDLDTLTEKIKKHNLPMEAFEWYLDLRRYGSVPHGGFGLGLERTVGWLCGIRHIREAIPFPRVMDRKIFP